MRIRPELGLTEIDYWFYKYIGISIWKNDDTLLATGIIFN